MKIDDLASAFRNPNVEIAYHLDSVARVGDYHEYFYSFCMLDEDFYSCHARFPVEPYYRRAEPLFIDDQVYITRYARNGGRLEPVDRRAIGRGGDPRMVSDRYNAYAVIILLEQCQSGRKIGALLYDLRRKRTVPIQVEAKDFPYGKNWQPYLLNGKLFIVHELAPFRVLEVDVETGRARVVQEVDISFKLPSFHTTYPMLRGGCNAIARNGMLLGVGRATSQRYRHHPFFWSFENNGKLNILFTEFFYRFHRCGYNILDPTSIFFEGEDLYFGLCCSERDWAHNQLVSHFLLRVPGGRSKPAGERLDAFLAERGSTERNGLPNLDRHMFFCIEMPSAAPSRHEFGGRLSTGTAGHLVHGPYLRIGKRGRFCAELSYQTKGEDAGRAGVFDVTVSRIDAGKQGDFRTLGYIDLDGTKGNMATARVAFETNVLIGALLEFRVYVNEGVELNAFHIRTWNMDADAPPWSAVHLEPQDKRRVGRS